jgi:hypothetical protein
LACWRQRATTPAVGDRGDDHRALEHTERRRDEVSVDVRAEARPGIPPATA